MSSTTAVRAARDGALILAVGAVVAATPAAWSTIVWPDGGSLGAGAWIYLFGFSVAPFVLVSFLRLSGALGRAAAAGATLIVAVVVVAGQVAGLDGNDPSSTASLALVTTPIFACVVAVAVAGVDRVAAGAVGLWRRRGRRVSP